MKAAVTNDRDRTGVVHNSPDFTVSAIRAQVSFWPPPRRRRDVLYAGSVVSRYTELVPFPNHTSAWRFYVYRSWRNTHDLIPVRSRILYSARWHIRMLLSQR